MLYVIDHPIVKVKISKLRNKDVDSKLFQATLLELTHLIAYEVTKNYQVQEIKIKTPLAPAIGNKTKDKIVLVPILRAGLGMVEGFKAIIPEAPVGFIGIYRNEKTLKPVDYYCKMPQSIKGANVIILDPMLATGGSAEKAIRVIKKHNPKSIKLVSILSVKQGINAVQTPHPDVDVYVCAIDEKLNQHGYIIPGMGDAGDRIFGTK
jgi:uracil phosphoribosyltransferase